jgi:hypothetical protein
MGVKCTGYSSSFQQAILTHVDVEAIKCGLAMKKPALKVRSGFSKGSRDDLE